MVSSDFLRAGYSQPVDQSGPVSVRLDRYQIEGSGLLTGTAYPMPLPSADGAHLRLTLIGQSSGVGTTTVRSVRLHTTSYSDVCVEQDVLVTPQGIAAGPPIVRAPTQSQLLSVETDKPPVRDLLARGMARLVFRMRPQRNAETATQVAEMSLGQQMERESQKRLADANKKFQDQFLDPLKDFELSQKDLHLASSPRAVFARVDLPGVPAVDPPPGFRTGDLGLCIHQEVLNKYFEQMLADTKHTGKPLEADLQDLYKSLNLDPMPPSDPRPWSISLAKHDPVTVRFDQDQVEILIRGAAYTIELEEYPPMNIIIRYGIVRTNDGFKAVRAMPTVFPPDSSSGAPKTLDRKQLTLILFLARKFSDLFPKEIDYNRLPLPERFPRSISGTYTRVHSQDGWLVQEWNMRRRDLTTPFSER